MIGLFGYEVQDSTQRARRSEERCTSDEQFDDFFSPSHSCTVVVVPCDLPDFAGIWAVNDAIVDLCDDHPDWAVGVRADFLASQKAIYRQYGVKRKW